MVLDGFHPAVRTWFERRFGTPSRAQELGWPIIAESQRSPGHDVLLCAPTGSGKTLAAFMWAINRLVLDAENDALIDEVSVLYVSPLKALANDIRLNLEEPLSGVKEVASELGLRLATIRAGLRTGDTPAGERTEMLKRPPQILVTTPESLFILLTSPRFREKLRAVRYVIVDELHAVAGNKRGAHLMVTLERLERMVRQGGAPRPARIGLSATLNPIETLAAFLAGAEVDSNGERHPRPVRIVRADDSVRALDLKIIALGPEVGALATHQHWEAMYDALASLIREHRTTLVFTLSRRWAERIALALQKRVGADAVMAHHGSLARAERLMAEQRLKRGELKAIVATASLELGIDVGAVDLVCQVDSPKSISAAIQRIGRSGHQLGATPKGRFFALTVDDLLECASAVRAIRRGHLDEIEVPSGCLDVAAQQVVAIAAEEDEIGDAELLRLLRRTYNFATLSAADLQRLLEEMAAQLPERIQGAAPKIFYDRIGARVRARRGARLAAITSGGTIPESGNYDVVIASEGRKIGEVEEDFAQESMRGDIFSLGSMPWRILGISKNRLMVEAAPGMAPSLPFWQTEAAGRSPALSAEVCDVRRHVAAFLMETGDGHGADGSVGADGTASATAATRWLMDECAVEENAAKQAVDYVRSGVAALGAIPDEHTLVVERFFDGLGGTQIVIHSPHGIRVNRGLGLALRKRLCQSFDFEIQASAIDDAVLLALNSRHSFGLEYVLTMLNARTVRDVLIQALLDAPMFEVRFRHVATRALSVMRSNRGRKVPAWMQRLRSQELITALFPQRNACFDNRPAAIYVPDHFIVRESVRECLEESTDLPRVVKLLEGLQDGSVRAVMADNVAPSAFAHRVLLAWDYSFLDDGERGNRRSRTVTMNRAMAEEVLREEELAEMLSADAIASVVEDVSGCAPGRRARNRDELYEIIRAHGALPADALAERAAGDAHAMIAALEADGRLLRARAVRRSKPIARVLRARAVPESPQTMIAAEDAAIFAAAYPRASWEGAASVSAAPGAADTDAAVEELVRRALATSGPTTANDLATRLWMPVAEVEGKLASLEAKGSVFRGHFTTRRANDVASAHGARANEQWCDRYVLERIHRQTLNRLRSEIEPCGDSEFAAFRLQWQHVGDSSIPPNPEGVGSVIEQLRGLAFTPEFWERAILAARIRGYRPEHLDLLCISGDIVWVAMPGEDGAHSGELPSQVAFLPRRYPLVGFRDARETTDPKERAVYGVLCERGAQYLDQVAERSGLSERDALGALWRLAAAGMVSNDSFAPLRLFWSDPDAARVVAPGSEHRGFSRHDAALRARLKSSLSGRWSLIESIGKGARDGNGTFFHRPGVRGSDVAARIDEERELAKLLLARNGIMSREMLALESVSVSWNEIVFALRRMEYAGTIRRGYFVRSLSGEQYALPEAVERLRAMRALNPSAEAPIALSAADPANPYGVLIPGCGITRDAANIVVIRAGRVILGLAGRALVTPAQLDDGEFGAALKALMALRPRLMIDTIDGCPALESGRVHVMAARGFHSDGRALVYDGLPGPRPSRVAAADAQRAHPQPRSET